MKTTHAETHANDVSERLLTVAEVGRLLAVSVRTIWRMRDSGELPQPLRVSQNSLRWRLSDIVAYMREGADQVWAT
jgi:predicted DNA-binding transcriptional regulator AlpA